MKDIANDLGVSLMTVSKALRGHTDVSEETRQRVLKRATEMNYRPNWVARSLITGRTHLIGLIIPDLMHSFFAEVAKGMERVMEPAGYHVVISNSEENAGAEERQLQLLLERSVDGIVLASAQPDASGASLQELLRRGTPFVLIDREIAGLHANFVGVQDEDVGFLAANHLIEQGCRRIAHIRGPHITTGEGRLRGYLRALKDAGLENRPDYIVRGDSFDDPGYSAMLELLKLDPRPDGVVCFNDPVGAGAMKAILEAGLRIPDDIAVIGAGNIHHSDLLRVPMSTIDQGSAQIGARAAELLLSHMKNAEENGVEQIVISARLIARQSSLRTQA